MIGKRQIRQHRLQIAQAELLTLQTELAFEQISVELSDGGRHWKFMYGDSHLADYWPASGRGQLTGQPCSISCASVAQAQKLAIGAKKRLFKEIAVALRQPSAAVEGRLLAPPG